MKRDIRVLFIGKAGDHWAERAAGYIMLHFHDPMIVFSKRGDPIPEEVNQWEGDLLISYLAQWVIPGPVLERATIAAINFHPGPPEYPGIGCTNFAIYNGEKQFGITCHHMLSRVDSGSIIMVRRFPIHNTDTLYSLTQRCYVEILHCFHQVIDNLMENNELYASEEQWTRQPYKRKELNALCEITPEMSAQEISRRLRATTFGDKVWAYVRIGDQQVTYSDDLKIREKALKY